MDLHVWLATSGAVAQLVEVFDDSGCVGLEEYLMAEQLYAQMLGWA